MVNNYFEINNNYLFASPVVKFAHFTARGDDVRIKCECGKTAKVTHRDEASTGFVRAYCDCHECGHRFTTLITFEKTILPAHAQSMDWIKGLIKELPLEERQALLNS